MSVSILSGLLWWHSDTSHIQDQLVSYIPLLVVVVMDYGQVGLLFFFSIFWGFFPLFNAIFTFPQERPMLIRERSSGMYRLSSYYFARMAGDLPMELVLPTIFVTIAYWMGGLKPSLLTFVLTLLVILYNVLVSQGLGLALGGYYIQHIPPFIAWLKYISFSHYCYKLLVGVQYAENEVYECGLRMHCKVWEFPAIKYLGIDHWAWDVAALTVMFVGYRALAYAALRMGQHH
ncbi:ABC transporter G family member 21 [Vitis vinifera]|uniref:ABC transporter G family member 21 n=1 Tax=Vitis vinifera TaxID=29760 RepID=A0A438EDE0_VITVI|nr:ABC transporter G family member 21 [Vitis vinifera]